MTDGPDTLGLDEALEHFLPEGIEGTELTDPALFADLERRNETFAHLHEAFPTGVMPSEGYPEDGVGVDVGDTHRSWDAIGIDTVQVASRNPVLAAYDGALRGLREETGYGRPKNPDDPAMDASGMLMFEEDTPDTRFLDQDVTRHPDDTKIHTRNRRHVHDALRELFDGLNVADAARHYLQEQATSVVDGIIQQGSADAAQELATSLPLNTIGDMLGIPPSIRDGIRAASNNALLFQDPEIAQTLEESNSAVAEVALHMAILAESTETPEDVNEALADFYETLQTREFEHKTIGDYTFNDTEITNMMLLLAIAGNETSRNAIALGVYALATHPEQSDALAQLSPEDDSYDEVWDNAVDEILRWGSPVIAFGRRATEDTELLGAGIEEGQPVMLQFAAANHDPSVFENPGEFDITRENAGDHVAFGGPGRHRCVGERLAREQVKIMLQEIVQRMPDFELAGEPEASLKVTQSTVITNVQRLDIAFTPGEEVVDSAA